METRGVMNENVWHNIERKRQVINSTGLAIGKREPTDIDALVEWNNIAYVVFEVKMGDKNVPYGQLLAIKRMILDFAKAGKPSMAIIVEHKVRDPEKQVDLANCKVREYYLSLPDGRNFHKANCNCLAKDLYLSFIEKVEGDKGFGNR